MNQKTLEKRKKVYDFFRKVALEDNQKNSKNKIDFEKLLDSTDKGKRLAIVMPKSVGDVYMVSALLPSIKETYPEYNIYFITEQHNFDLLDGNPFIHRLIQYTPQLDNLLFLEGQADHEGFFEIAFLPHIGTQKILNYLHNGKTRDATNIKNF